MTAGGVPPGWYAREGYQQYWNGSAWTADTAPLPGGGSSTAGWRATPWPRGPVAAARVVLTNYANFSGRATRSEYWWWAFVIALPAVVIYLLTAGDQVGEDTRAAGVVVLVGLTLAALLPSLAVTVRRLHDSGRSGLWILVQFVPVVGPFVLLVLTLLDGTPGPNRYGPAAGS